MLKSINIRSSVAVYAQIENEVQFAIASGRVKGGDQLPSLKELADRLGINFNTVAKAYRDLEVMGYVSTRRGMGVFINRGVEDQCRERCRASVVGRLHEVVAEAKAAGLSLSDLKEVVQKCLSVDSSPYGEVPAEVLALAKGKTKGK